MLKIPMKIEGLGVLGAGGGNVGLTNLPPMWGPFGQRGSSKTSDL